MMRAICAALAFLFAFVVMTSASHHVTVRPSPTVTSTERHTP